MRGTGPTCTIEILAVSLNPGEVRVVGLHRVSRDGVRRQMLQGLMGQTS